MAIGRVLGLRMARAQLRRYRRGCRVRDTHLVLWLRTLVCKIVTRVLSRHRIAASRHVLCVLK